MVPGGAGKLSSVARSAGGGHSFDFTCASATHSSLSPTRSQAPLLAADRVTENPRASSHSRALCSPRRPFAAVFTADAPELRPRVAELGSDAPCP